MNTRAESPVAGSSLEANYTENDAKSLVSVLVGQRAPCLHSSYWYPVIIGSGIGTGASICDYAFAYSTASTYVLVMDSNVAACWGDVNYNGFMSTAVLGRKRVLSKSVKDSRGRLVPKSSLSSSLQSTMSSSPATDAPRVLLYILPPGESTKCRKYKEEIENFLLQNGCGRDTCLIAIGGGVIGDLVGYVASGYMRGIDYMQVPTSLLSMVDSSVGGKTAIDHDNGLTKNVYGAFKQPVCVLADVDYLSTLPVREYNNGMAEVVKTALLYSEGLLSFLEVHCEQLSAPKELDSVESNVMVCNSKRAYLRDMLAECIKIKSEVVTIDEREQSLRAALNVGHSVGHAVEALCQPDLLHGECVSIGMLVELDIARRLGILQSGSVYRRVATLLKAFCLPVEVPVHCDVEALMRVMGKDKKNAGGVKKINLIVNVGAVAGVVTRVDEKKMCAQCPVHRNPSHDDVHASADASTAATCVCVRVGDIVCDYYSAGVRGMHYRHARAQQQEKEAAANDGERGIAHMHVPSSNILCGRQDMYPLTAPCMQHISSPSTLSTTRCACDDILASTPFTCCYSLPVPDGLLRAVLAAPTLIAHPTNAAAAYALAGKDANHAESGSSAGPGSSSVPFRSATTHMLPAPAIGTSRDLLWAHTLASTSPTPSKKAMRMWRASLPVDSDTSMDAVATFQWHARYLTSSDTVQTPAELGCYVLRADAVAATTECMDSSNTSSTTSEPSEHTDTNAAVRQEPLSARALEVAVPGSKSLSNRVLLLCAMSTSVCRIQGLLLSQDTQVMLASLRQMGVEMEWEKGERVLRIHGNSGKFNIPDSELYMNNAGTAARFLTATICTLRDPLQENYLDLPENGDPEPFSGKTVFLTGSDRMQKRPIADLVKCLIACGADVTYTNKQGCLPLSVRPRARAVRGGELILGAAVSSQYVSAVLLAAPNMGTHSMVTLDVSQGEAVSLPFVRMTVEGMRGMGVHVCEIKAHEPVPVEVTGTILQTITNISRKYADMGISISRKPIDSSFCVSDCIPDLASVITRRDHHTLTLLSSLLTTLSPSACPRFFVPHTNYHAPASLWIEGDASSATYPLALAAVTGSSVTVMNVGHASTQGDAMFANVLARMGCGVCTGQGYISVTGPPPLVLGQDKNGALVCSDRLHTFTTPLYGTSTGKMGGVLTASDANAAYLRSTTDAEHTAGVSGPYLRGCGVVDCSSITDTFLTVATVAALSFGPSLLTNIPNQRVKECNRISAVVDMLLAAGVRAVETPDGLWIGGVVRESEAEGWGDRVEDAALCGDAPSQATPNEGVTAAASATTRPNSSLALAQSLMASYLATRTTSTPTSPSSSPSSLARVSWAEASHIAASLSSPALRVLWGCERPTYDLKGIPTSGHDYRCATIHSAVKRDAENVSDDLGGDATAAGEGMRVDIVATIVRNNGKVALSPVLATDTCMSASTSADSGTSPSYTCITPIFASVTPTHVATLAKGGTVTVSSQSQAGLDASALTSLPASSSPSFVTLNLIARSLLDIAAAYASSLDAPAEVHLEPHRDMFGVRGWWGGDAVSTLWEHTITAATPRCNDEAMVRGDTPTAIVSSLSSALPPAHPLARTRPLPPALRALHWRVFPLPPLPPCHYRLLACHNDHRVPMSATMLMVRLPYVAVADKHCVAKTFPEFWDFIQIPVEKVGKSAVPVMSCLIGDASTNTDSFGNTALLEEALSHAFRMVSVKNGKLTVSPQHLRPSFNVCLGTDGTIASTLTATLRQPGRASQQRCLNIISSEPTFVPPPPSAHRFPCTAAAITCNGNGNGTNDFVAANNGQGNGVMVKTITGVTLPLPLFDPTYFRVPDVGGTTLNAVLPSYSHISNALTPAARRSLAIATAHTLTLTPALTMSTEISIGSSTTSPSPSCFSLLSTSLVEARTSPTQTSLPPSLAQPSSQSPSQKLFSAIITHITAPIPQMTVWVQPPPIGPLPASVMLSGMRASGKTSLSGQLARKLCYDSVDIDVVITDVCQTLFNTNISGMVSLTATEVAKRFSDFVSLRLSSLYTLAGDTHVSCEKATATAAVCVFTALYAHMHTRVHAGTNTTNPSFASSDPSYIPSSLTSALPTSSWPLFRVVELLCMLLTTTLTGAVVALADIPLSPYGTSLSSCLNTIGVPILASLLGHLALKPGQSFSDDVTSTIFTSYYAILPARPLVIATGGGYVQTQTLFWLSSLFTRLRQGPAYDLTHARELQEVASLCSHATASTAPSLFHFPEYSIFSTPIIALSVADTRMTVKMPDMHPLRDTPYPPMRLQFSNERGMVQDVATQVVTEVPVSPKHVANCADTSPSRGFITTSSASPFSTTFPAIAPVSTSVALSWLPIVAFLHKHPVDVHIALERSNTRPPLPPSTMEAPTAVQANTAIVTSSFMTPASPATPTSFSNDMSVDSMLSLSVLAQSPHIAIYHRRMPLYDAAGLLALPIALGDTHFDMISEEFCEVIQRCIGMDTIDIHRATAHLTAPSTVSSSSPSASCSLPSRSSASSSLSPTLLPFAGMAGGRHVRDNTNFVCVSVGDIHRYLHCDTCRNNFRKMSLSRNSEASGSYRILRYTEAEVIAMAHRAPDTCSSSSSSLPPAPLVCMCTALRGADAVELRIDLLDTYHQYLTQTAQAQDRSTVDGEMSSLHSPHSLAPSALALALDPPPSTPLAFLRHLLAQQIATLRRITRAPIIATVRSVHQGGRFTGDVGTWAWLTLQAARMGCALVDVEADVCEGVVRAMLDAIGRIGSKAILSHHLLNGCGRDIDGDISSDNRVDISGFPKENAYQSDSRGKFSEYMSFPSSFISQCPSSNLTLCGRVPLPSPLSLSSMYSLCLTHSHPTVEHVKLITSAHSAYDAMFVGEWAEQHRKMPYAYLQSLLPEEMREKVTYGYRDTEVWTTLGREFSVLELPLILNPEILRYSGSQVHARGARDEFNIALLRNTMRANEEFLSGKIQTIPKSVFRVFANHHYQLPEAYVSTAYTQLQKELSSKLGKPILRNYVPAPIPSLIAMSMGVAGSLSRVVNAHMTPVTHQAMPFPAAPGQLTNAQIQRQRLSLSLDRLSSYYIIGSPVAGSPSPHMHNSVFYDLGVPKLMARYETNDAVDAYRTIIRPSVAEDTLRDCQHLHNSTYTTTPRAPLQTSYPCNPNATAPTTTTPQPSLPCLTLPVLASSAPALACPPITPSYTFAGAAVTIPLKEDMLVHMADTDCAVKAIGALNTIVSVPQEKVIACGMNASPRENGIPKSVLVGFNTDWIGIAAPVFSSLSHAQARAKEATPTRETVAARLEVSSLPLSAAISPQRSIALVIGAGGTARAAIFALLQLGYHPSHIVVYNRTYTRAEQLAAYMGVNATRVLSLHHVQCAALGTSSNVLENPISETSYSHGKPVISAVISTVPGVAGLTLPPCILSQEELYLLSSTPAFTSISVETVGALTDESGVPPVNSPPLQPYDTGSYTPVRHFPVVMDVAYRPRATALLLQAMTAGLPIVRGVDMLICQAQAQMRLWTGREIGGECVAAGAWMCLNTVEPFGP